MRIFENFQKGVNLGGWISQFAKYDIEHFDTFITKKDIDYIASLGFDHVRVPVDYNVLEDEEGNPIDSGFKYLTDCLEWCKANNLHMLIDLHECYGYSFDPLKDMDRRKFFYDEALQERFFKLWERIAETFKNDQDTVAFEPLNEVVLQEVAEAWNGIVAKYIKRMRAICPDAWIVIGGVMYNHVSNVKLLDPPADDKIVYNFHCYEPFLFTHQGAYWVDYMPKDFRVEYPLPIEDYRRISKEAIDVDNGVIFMDEVKELGPDFFEIIFKDALIAAEKNNAPLYCGEYGAIDLSDNKSKINWLRDIHTAFKNHNIGRALWNYKEKDFGFVDESFKEVQDDFIKVL